MRYGICLGATMFDTRSNEIEYRTSKLQRATLVQCGRAQPIKNVIGVLTDWLGWESAKASVSPYFDAVAEVYPISLSRFSIGRTGTHSLIVDGAS